MSVSIRPGATTLTQILRLPTSRARALAGADETGLGGGIVDLPGLANLAGDGGDRDDAPAAGADHGEEDGVHDVVEAVKVGADDGGPFLGLHPDEEIVAGYAGVEDDNGGGCLVGTVAEGFFGGGEIADVEAEKLAFATEGFDLAGGFFCLVVVGAIGEPDVASAAGEAEGDGFANASAAANDQSDVWRTVRQGETFQDRLAMVFKMPGTVMGGV